MYPTAYDAQPSGSLVSSIPIGRNEEVGVAHPQGGKDAIADEDVEALPGGAADQHALQEASGVVHPAFARLVHQRQGGEAGHPKI